MRELERHPAADFGIIDIQNRSKGSPGNLFMEYHQTSLMKRFTHLLEEAKPVLEPLKYLPATATLFGALLAWWYYGLLHFLPAVSATDVIINLLALAFNVLILTGLPILMFLIVAPWLRSVLRPWLDVVDALSTRESRIKVMRRTTTWLLLVPPMGAALAVFGTVVVLAHSHHAIWVLLAYAMIASLCSLLPFCIRRRISGVLAKEPTGADTRRAAVGLMGFWLFFALLGLLSWSELARGLNGRWWYAYLPVALVTGGWAAGVWAANRERTVRAAFVAVFFVSAVIASNGILARNILDAALQRAGIEARNTAVVLAGAACGAVRAVCGEACETRNAGDGEGASAGAAPRIESLAVTPSQACMVRNVDILSDVGSRYLLGVPRGSGDRGPPGDAALVCGDAFTEPGPECGIVVVRSRDVVTWSPMRLETSTNGARK